MSDLEKLQRSPQGMAAWQTAQHYLVDGRHGPAATSYRNLTRQFPTVAQLWAELSIAAAGELNFAAAAEAAQKASDLAAGNSDLLVSIGQQFSRLRKVAEAGKCYQRAVQADSSSVNARLSLCAWFERNHRLDEALQCVEELQAKSPNNPRAQYFKALVLHRKGLDADAEKILRDLLQTSAMDPDVRIPAMHLLGVIFDSLGQYTDALIWIEKAKDSQRQLTDTSAMERAYNQMDHARRELLASVTADVIRRWRQESATLPCPHPLVFLGGPPRSGVTLVEQILGANSDILVFDEPEAFAQEILSQLHPKPPARCLTFKSLNTLAPSASSRLIDRYFKHLLREAEEPPAGRWLVDKNPSLTPALHVWLKLFAKLKVVITLRDPRDVIISCYFQNLPLSAPNANFLTLDRTMKFYSDCMDAWLRLRELGGFEWIETRYEQLVGNLQNEGRRVMNFIGLPWQEAQANFYAPKRRNFILASAYDDVVKPLYNTSLARWKHYEQALAPLQARLEPYLKAFGYQ